jgi:hypothetical protein
MPIVSKCPKCGEQVTIPDGLDPEAEVRCPLCVVVYPLRDALAEAPPALVPVDPGAIGGPRPDSDALAKSDLISERFHVPDSDDLAEPREAETESAVDEAPVLDAWQEADVAPEIDTGAAGDASPTDASHRYPIDTGQTPVDTDAPATFGIEASEGQSEPGTAGPSKSQRKKKKTKGPVRFLGEVFLGGFGGLLIGYYVLCWAVWGLDARRNIPKLPLPLLPHTMDWFAGAEQPENVARQPATGEPGTSKRVPGHNPRLPPTTPTETNLAAPDIPPVELPTDQPEPEPEPLPQDYIGPRAPPSFTSAELGQALKAAHDALSGDGTTAPMSPQTYREFCRLGHVLTFVETDARDGFLADRKQAVRKILEGIGDRPGGTGQIGRLAGALLEDRQSLHGGILLAGTAGPVASRGGLHGTIVRLAGHTDSISLLSDRRLPFADGDQVVILGSIVGNPAENLVGYSGSRPLVVWAGTAVKLPQ